MKQINPAVIINRLISKAFTVFLIVLSPQLFAQESVLVAPEPISLDGSEVPGFGTEGLHIMRFTVKADGSTDDIEVVGGFTNGFLEKMLVESVAKWTFTPGTENGEAVNFYNQEYIIKATLPGKLSDGLGLSESNQKNVEDIDKLMADKKYIRALTKINNKLSKGIVTNFDYAILHNMKSEVYIAQNNNFAALEAIKVATMGRVNMAGETEYFLTPDVLESALKKRILLAASVQQYPESLRALEILKANFDISADDQILTQGAAIEDFVATGEPLGMRAKIIDNIWSYEPYWPTFTITAVDGAIKQINARCDRRNFVLDFEADVEWNIPGKFGKCMLEIEGKDNTEFSLYEFAD